MRSRSDRRSDRMLLYPCHRKKAATAPARCCSVCVKAVAIHKDELRELADGAQIKHSRINKLPTLRQRLTERFADMLPDQDE